MPDAVADFRNPCGGLGWRQLSDGTFEIQGEGVVVPPPGEGTYSYRTFVRNSWRNFEPEIRAAARKRGVPVEWVLAIVATETGIVSGSREKQASFGNFCCRGPMAVMVTPYPNHRTFGGYTHPDEMFEPAKAIDAGAAIMRSYMDKGLDLPEISARYNSGGLCCPTSPELASKPGGRVLNEFKLCSAKIAGISYPRMTMMMNNFAIRELGVRTSTARVLAFGLGAASLVGVAGWWMTRDQS